MTRSRLDLVRWQIGYASFSVPQAAAPIAFALVALPLTGSAEAGAGLVFAMTTSQVLAAIPTSRWGTRFNAVSYLRALLAFRTAALVAMTVLTAVGAPFVWLFVAAIAAGLVNGGAYGYQRLVLNYLVPENKLPRALGVAATLNEVIFALAPVLASLVGAVSPVAAMVALTVLGVGPLVLMPRVPEARGLGLAEIAGPRPRIPAAAFLWLFCAIAGGSAIAAVEVGAVAFALEFGLPPGAAFLFALVLCAGSVAGGVWVSIRNRMPKPWQVVAYLAVTAAASALVTFGGHLALVLIGAAVIGIFLPMLGTFYSLILDRLAPPERRAEIFALLRTAQSLGIIVSSGLLALWGLQVTLRGSFALVVAALVAVAVYTVAGIKSGDGPPPPAPSARH